MKDFLEVYHGEYVAHLKDRRVRREEAHTLEMVEKDLSGFNVHHLDLSFSNFNKSNFTGAKFYLCDLAVACFEEAQFHQAEFVLCDLTETSFYQADLSSCWFTSCRFNDVDFEKCKMNWYESGLVGPRLIREANCVEEEELATLIGAYPLSIAGWNGLLARFQPHPYLSWAINTMLMWEVEGDTMPLQLKDWKEG